MWTCPKCNAKVEAAFQICGNCGTKADGTETPGFVRVDGATATANVNDRPPISQRLWQGAKAGAILGALSCALYALMLWSALTFLVVAEFEQDKLVVLGSMLLQAAVTGAVLGAVIGALYRLVLPQRSKKAPPLLAPPPADKTDLPP